MHFRSTRRSVKLGVDRYCSKVNTKNNSLPDCDKSVMYIKDRMRVRDASGKEFDIEMDLKVEIQPARPEIEDQKLGEGHFSSRFMCPISIPWRHAFSKKQVESGGTKPKSAEDVFKVKHFGYRLHRKSCSKKPLTYFTRVSINLWLTSYLAGLD